MADRPASSAQSEALYAYRAACAVIVDAERLARYADKFERIDERLGQFEAWSPKAGEDEMSRAASFKAFQEIGDGLADVCAMLTKDLGMTPKDDYTNARKLEEHGVLTEGQCEVVFEVNGLRNRLVHEYDTLDEERALESASRLVPPVRELTQEVRTWISENA